MTKTKSVFILAAVLLSGCSTMNSEFSCKATANDRCLTIEQVDAMTQYANGHNTGFKPRAHLRVAARPHTQLTYRAQKTTSPPIWVAPFTDKSGQVHQEALLYAEPHQPRAQG